MPDPGRYGHATCHPEKFAVTRAGLCSKCYQRARLDRIEKETQMQVGVVREAARELGLDLVTTDRLGQQRLLPETPPPTTLAEAVKMTDAELIAALPEAAIVLRRHLQGKAGLKAAELLLRSYVVATADGPRRILSTPGTNEKPVAGTQVVIGLALNPGADGTMQLGKVVGTVEPTLVGQKAAPKK